MQDRFLYSVGSSVQHRPGSAKGSLTGARAIRLPLSLLSLAKKKPCTRAHRFLPLHHRIHELRTNFTRLPELGEKPVTVHPLPKDRFSNELSDVGNGLECQGDPYGIQYSGLECHPFEFRRFREVGRSRPQIPWCKRGFG